MKAKHIYKNLAFKLLKVILPIVLLTIIFLHVDLISLLVVFKTIDIKYLFISLIFANIIQVLGGATRWYYLVRKNIRVEKVLKYITIYWASMFYGYFVPSNVGMDIYRVAAVGKKQKNYEQHIVIILGEKFYTLVFSTLVLFVSYIVVYQEIKGSEVAYALNIIFIIFVIVTIFLIILFLVFKRLFSTLMLYIRNKFNHYFQVISSKLSSKITVNFMSFRDELPYLIKKRFINTSLIFTVLLRLSLTVGGFFLFLSLGIKLSFWYLLFANSIFFILFLLPISFGSLGVREGAYIIIYGLFGVSPEIALAGSLLALAGLVFTISIGGIISLTEGLKKIS